MKREMVMVTLHQQPFSKPHFQQATNFQPTFSASHKFKKELSQKERAKAAKCLTVRRKEFVITHAHQKKQAVKRIKENLLPNIQKCIKD